MKLGVILGVILFVTLPFASKAFHIDDVYFIEIAENILRDPRRPFAGSVALEDIDYRAFAASGRCPSTFASMSHPPLVPYVIAFVAWMAGGFSETWLHLAFVPFAMGAGLAAHSLAGRFTRHPLAATLLLVSSPIFILSAQSVMTDMPALALSAGALALFVQGVDREKSGRVVGAGLLAGLAVVTRYSALTTVPVLAAYGLARGKPRRALPALVGLAIVLAPWAAQNLLANGELHVVASARHYRLFYAGPSFEWTGFLNRVLADVAGLGGTAFVAAALLLLAGTRRRPIAFAAASLGAAAVFVVRPRGMERLETYSAGEVAWVAGLVGLGAVLLMEALSPEPSILASTGRPLADGRRDHAFLVAWLTMALAGALLVLPFGTARYLLPVLPPFWLLLARRAESIVGGDRERRRAFTLVVAQGLALGTVLSLADDDHAGRYRAAARTIREAYPARTIWFVGEWGFRYYMRRVGGRYLRSADGSPQRGDVIVRPEVAGMHEMSADVRGRAVPLQEIALRGRLSVRLVSFEAKAGYYSHHWGYLPWAFSHTPLDRIEIFEVRAPGGGQTEVETCASS